MVTIIKNYKKYAEIYLLVTIILLFIFRSSNPLFKYPFFILYISYFPVFFVNIRNNGLDITKDFLKSFSIILLFFIVILAAFIFSDKLYLIVFKEIVSIVILLTFSFFLFYAIPNRERLRILFDSLVNLILVFSVIITISGLLDTFGILRYQDYFLLEKSYFRSYPYDTNFGLLPVIFSTLSIIYFFAFKDLRKFYIILLEILTFFYSFFILLSGSRRGIFILFSVTALVIFLSLLSYLKNKIISAQSRIRLLIFSSIILINIFGIFIFVNDISFLAKNSLLNAIHTKDITETKEKISSKLLKIYKFYDSEILLKDFHEMVWSMEYNSFDPDLGWGGMGVHQTIYPLTGADSNLVPVGAKGYLMDHTYEAATWDGDAYSITLLGRLNAAPSDHIEASVFCYVSEDYNCDWVRLILLFTKSKELHSDYDLSKKGTWQKLYLKDTGNNEFCESRFYFSDLGATDLDSMKGYVIIAFPRFEKQTSDGRTESFYIYPPVDSIPSTSTSEKLHNSKDNIHLSSIFAITNSSILLIDDPFRTFVSKLFSEDTTYTPFKTNLIPESVKLPLPDDRMTRWKLGFNIFIKEYPLYNKLFGGGFKHMNWYGYLYLKRKDISDWPHNPFISILLYSGVFGLVIALFLYFKAVKYYLKYFRFYPLLFVFFILTFIFSFVSGDSPFDPPVMGFFIMLPFLINYIHKKDPEPLDN